MAFTILLTTFIMNWGYYLIRHDYNLREHFTNEDGSRTSHTVDLPLNNPLECRNFCNPLSICAITGGQCTSDVDCPGCEALASTSGANYGYTQQDTSHVMGDNDAGKMLSAVKNYSSLTTDSGTRAPSLPHTQNMPSPRHIQGDDLWASRFNSGMEIYDKRYNPGASPLIMNYPVTYTMTGEFLDNGPPAANSTL